MVFGFWWVILSSLRIWGDYEGILAWEFEGINWFLARGFEGWEETKNYAGYNCKIDGDEANFKADEGFKWSEGGTEDGD